MAVSAHNVTTQRDIVKELQFVTEGNSVTSPALYGVTPTGSTFALVGNNSEINIQPDVQHMDVAVLGSEDVIDAVKTQSLYAFTIRSNPINLDLWKYLWNSSGTGASSPDSSLSFTYSYNLGGTEHFQHMRGCRPTSGTLSVSRGVWEQSMTFIAKDITIPSTSTGDGGTPTYQTAETSSSPIVHSDGGGSPFTWNSVGYGERSFSTTVTRGMAVMAVNGENDITYTKANDRSINFTTDVFAGTASNLTAMYTDYEGKTARAASYKFTTSPSKTLTFANAIITDYSYSHAAGSADALIESISCRAESCTNL
jgi:hypothetical protein